MKPAIRLIATTTLLLLLLSACGSPAAPEEPAAPPEAPEATHTHPPAPTDPPQEESVPEEEEQGVSISLTSFTFRPASVTVKAGTTVTWRNAEDAPHTVTADDGSFASSTLGLGDTFSFTFSEPGTYDYHCEFHGAAGHAGMSGTIVVEE